MDFRFNTGKNVCSYLTGKVLFWAQYLNLLEVPATGRNAYFKYQYAFRTSFLEEEMGIFFTSSWQQDPQRPDCFSATIDMVNPFLCGEEETCSPHLTRETGLQVSSAGTGSPHLTHGTGLQVSPSVPHTSDNQISSPGLSPQVSSSENQISSAGTGLQVSPSVPHTSGLQVSSAGTGLQVSPSVPHTSDLQISFAGLSLQVSSSENQISSPGTGLQVSPSVPHTSDNQISSPGTGFPHLTHGAGLQVSSSVPHTSGLQVSPSVPHTSDNQISSPGTGLQVSPSVPHTSDNQISSPGTGLQVSPPVPHTSDNQVSSPGTGLPDVAAGAPGKDPSSLFPEGVVLPRFLTKKRKVQFHFPLIFIDKVDNRRDEKPKQDKTWPEDFHVYPSAIYFSSKTESVEKFDMFDSRFLFFHINVFLKRSTVIEELFLINEEDYKAIMKAVADPINKLSLNFNVSHTELIFLLSYHPEFNTHATTRGFGTYLATDHRIYRPEMRAVKPQGFKTLLPI